MARGLERAAADDIRPSAGFADRVMAAIVAEPAPRVIVRPAETVRGGMVGAFLASVRDAWKVSTSPGRPTFVRAQAMGFVFLVVLATGSLSTLAAIGAAGFISQDDHHTPAPTLPIGPSPRPTSEPTPATPSPSSEPTPSETPAETTEPSETPDATETTGGTSSHEPGTTPRPTEHQTAKPTKTPHETESPEPSETPEPSDGSDGSGGSGGSGDGSGHDGSQSIGSSPQPSDDQLGSL
jgi:outer membrane biosynthesis protein TonB